MNLSSCLTYNFPSIHRRLVSIYVLSISPHLGMQWCVFLHIRMYDIVSVHVHVLVCVLVCACLVMKVRLCTSVCVHVCMCICVYVHM